MELIGSMQVGWCLWLHSKAKDVVVVVGAIALSTADSNSPDGALVPIVVTPVGAVVQVVVVLHEAKLITIVTTHNP